MNVLNRRTLGRMGVQGHAELREDSRSQGRHDPADHFDDALHRFPTAPSATALSSEGRIETTPLSVFRPICAIGARMNNPS
jgi:hypothetical protein